MGELLEGEFEFTGDRAYGYQVKRLLIGNPKPIPMPKVRFIRFTRWKHYRHPCLHKVGWEIVGPPRRPRKTDTDFDRRTARDTIGVVWCWWYNPNQWEVWLPRCSKLFDVMAHRSWDRYRGAVTLLGITFWRAKTTPPR